MREVRASGLEYLGLATDLLQRARLADPEAGLWEAADVQWWWRMPRRSDTVEQLFWLDDDGPVASVALTDWKRAWGCDLLVVPGAGVSVPELWNRALESLDGLGEVEMLIRDDDGELLKLAREVGFVGGDELCGLTWMDAENRPEQRALPEGFALVDRRDATKPHPMRARNGEQVEARLNQCSLYDAGLDLAIESPDGEAAGRALFWFDPVTKVGLLEPMRVDEAYQRRGLARALIAAGLERLAARGARRMKVGYSVEAARALYTGSGFQVTATSRSYILRR